MRKYVPSYSGTLRSHGLTLPHCTASAAASAFRKAHQVDRLFHGRCHHQKHQCRRDHCGLPFTPQASISQAVINVADVPVFVGVGGGYTNGSRSVRLAMQAEHQGAYGVVVNAPMPNEVIAEIKSVVDIPVIATVVSDRSDIKGRIEAGTDIFNVSGAAETASIVRHIREQYPHAAIIATGRADGGEHFRDHPARGANAITITPPTTGELFVGIMHDYRENEAVRVYIT